MTIDTEPEVARGESMNVREALAALDYHAAKAEKRGDYGCHCDLLEIRAVIEAQQKAITELRSAGGELIRKLRAGVQSLTSKPS